MRLEQLRLQQVSGQRRYPLRLDRGQPTSEEACGFDELGAHDPAPRLLAQVGARMAPELDAARAQVPVIVVALEADVAQQAGQE